MRWHWECIEPTLVKASNDRVKFRKSRLNQCPLLPATGFPAGVDVHWETQRRMVWNEREHTSEEREMVYEISWVAEIGLWRSFLRSQPKVKS